ncbi:TetR/AcrR family transcriptional regulator [Amycolatopsis echigonensis]|uniref:TetR family transcriptional regulator n=1 Tax=Amycolatopsis echigonensis TaxID=2576905 RepID=A0A2N3WUA7_9PSEU|nr:MULTISPECIES: TetR/AcrR family transcriptional regulator [Amycolatopsis]MBB2503806.1 TetR/AcrR family transcriptional regulator [Amycolatopsis echigonensis]PKV97466.1 TetR family transcriptional regulator [Amycolatopsis niigatensis]
MTAASAAPAAGKRPRNRRALIVAAASDLFARDGYDQTTMSDIAAAVAIGPSAVYRHFPGKQQLLAEVVTAGLEPAQQLVDALDLRDRAAALPRLAALTLDQRHLGVLWQREARHLADDDRVRLRTQLRGIGHVLAERVQAVRPALGPAAADLLSWSMIAVLSSPGFHRIELPRPRHDRLLADLLATVLDTDPPAAFTTAPPAPPAAGLTPASRREALLNQAVRMFAAHGYREVGVEDIGAAVGISGPSVYNHYPSKLDMLTTAFHRGTAALFTDVAAAYTTAASAEDALRTLIRSYVAFGRAHHDLLGLLVTEISHLPADERERRRQAQRDYLAEWTHLLRQVHPGLDATAARLRVDAAIDVVNSAVRTPHLRRNPDLPAALGILAARLLQLPEAGQAR